jgi:hypothetical protein
MPGTGAQEMHDSMAQVRVESQKAPLRRFRPYPEYKDSGVEWIGEIPCHWKIFAIKRLLRVQSGDFIPADDETAEGIRFTEAMASELTPIVPILRAP